MIKLQFDNKFKARLGTAIYGFAIAGLLACIILCSIILGVAKENISENKYLALQTSLNLLFQISNGAVLATVLIKNRTRPDYFLKTKISPLCYIAGFAFGLISIFCFMGFAESAQKLLDVIGYKLAPDYTTGIVAQDIALLVVTVGIAPVLEELIYRGALLSGLRRKFSPLKSALLCAVAFSLMHMNPEQTVYQFCLGFGASLLTMATGSVIPSIIMHMTSNMIAALGIMKVRGFADFFDFYEKVFMGSVWAEAVSTVLLTLAGAAIIILGALLIYKKQKPDPIEHEEAPPVVQSEAPAVKTRRKKGMFSQFNDKAKVYYFISLGLTGVMWLVILMQGL